MHIEPSCPDCPPIIRFGTPRMPYREPFADGVRMGGHCPSIVCEMPGLGDIDPCITQFTAESTALPSDMVCCSGEGIADHCTCCNLRLMFAPAPSGMLKRLLLEELSQKIGPPEIE